MDSDTPIGVVGVGTMGSLAAGRLRQAGYEVVAYDLSPTAQDEARGAGISVVPTLRDLADRVDGGIVLLVLPGPKVVEAVVAAPDGLLSGPSRPGIVVDMTTSSPATTRRMAQLAAEHGTVFLDAPVLGRPRSVGRWVLPVGGDAAALDRCRPVLASFAGSVVHVGPSGAGHTLKLLNTLMFGAINAMTAEMMAISKKVGLEPAVLFEILAGSEAGTVSNLFKELAPKIIQRDFAPIFSIDLLCKDNGLALEMAREAGAPPLLATTVQFINELARAQGYGSSDTSALILLYERLLERADGDLSEPQVGKVS